MNHPFPATLLLGTVPTTGATFAAKEDKQAKYAERDHKKNLFNQSKGTEEKGIVTVYRGG